ncbi:MAG: exo-alpha-sialidase [Spirochaetales bacterium]|nr:exo-alpha-sialidase [Spirochaetales bacterium]
MVKYILFLAIVFVILTGCPYFDPMHGIKILSYGGSYTLPSSGSVSRILCEKGHWSYNNAAARGDNVYVVYYDEIKDGLILTRSKDRGVNWSAAVLDSSSRAATLINMSEVEGVLYIAFNSGDRLVAMVSYDGGDSVRRCDIGAYLTSGDGYPGITGYGDNVYISYCNAHNDTEDICDIMCAWSEDRGLTFTTVAAAADIPGFSSPSSIAYSTLNDDVHIVFRGTDDYIHHTYSADLETWEAPSQISTTPIQSCKAIIDDGGVIHVAVAGGGGALYFYSGNNGGTWTGPANINGDAVYSTDISMTLEEGGLHAAYYLAGAKEFRYSKRPVSTWNAVTVDLESSAGSGTGRLCSVAASGSLVVVTYVDDGDNPDDDDDNRLRLAVSTNGGETFD